VSALGVTRGRLAIAGAVAASGAVAVLLLTRGDEANGGPSGMAGRWTELEPSPLTRTEVGAARIDRFVYVVGGFLPPDGETTDLVARYDTDTGTWSQAEPMPVAVNHPAVAAHGGQLYVYGGFTDEGALSGETDALQRYDPAANTWTSLAGSGLRRGAATLAPVGDSLYAIGGAANGSTPLKAVQVYDVAGGSWRPGPPLAVAREHLASAVLGRRVLAIAGRAGGRNLDVVEVLDGRGGRWRRLPPLDVPRSGFQAVTVRGRAVAVGGEELEEGGETIRPVEIYLPGQRRWARLPGMRTPRHGLGVAASGRRVFAAEGGPQPGFAFSDALEVLVVPKRLPGG
jgi:Kelch motif